MQRLPKQLSTTELTGTTAVQYTAPTNTRTTISAASVTNKTGTARWYTVTVTPSGGSAYYVAFQLVLGAGKTAIVTGLIGHTLDAGGAVNAFAEVGSAIDMVISGYETNP